MKGYRFICLDVNVVVSTTTKMLGIILLSLFGIFLFHQFYWRRLNFPPGPVPWPFIGNLNILDLQNIDNQLLEFKKNYGSVFTIWIPKPVIVVGGLEQLRSVFVKNGDKVAGRPYSYIMEEIFMGPYGIVLAHDSFWKSQRKFLLQILRDFGVGKPILEDAITIQASDACNYFKSLNGKPIDVKKILSTCIGNIIFQLIFGTTISLENNLINEKKEKALNASKAFCHPFVFFVTLFPPLKYLRFLAGKSYHDSIKSSIEFANFFKGQIKEHRESIDYDAEPRDYTDAFLIEQKKRNPTMKEDGEWSDKQLIGGLSDIFGAGIETTASTFEMFIFYMLHNPGIQKKIHEEIDRVIGRDKTIAMTDHPKLPYLNACIQELQRITVVIPMNLFHRTMEEVSIGGFLIPPDTTVIPQFELVHKDEKEFPDPWKFDPSRFLDAQNNFIKDDRVTPFSVGKRSCAGEALARMELFLLAATFFQRFEFQPENPAKLPPFEFVYTLAKNIKSFNCRIIERK